MVNKNKNKATQDDEREKRARAIWLKALQRLTESSSHFLGSKPEVWKNIIAKRLLEVRWNNKLCVSSKALPEEEIAPMEEWLTETHERILALNLAISGSVAMRFSRNELGMPEVDCLPLGTIDQPNRPKLLS